MAQNHGPYSPPPNSQAPLPGQSTATQQTPQATGLASNPPPYTPPNVEKPTQAHYNPYPGQQYRQEANVQQSYYGPPQDQYWSQQQYNQYHNQYHNQPQPQPQPQIVFVQAPPQQSDADCLPCACLGILTAVLFCPFFFCC